MPDAPAKICIICNQDCSARPRTKDKLGRYICQSCADARKHAKATPAPFPAPAPFPDPLPAPSDHAASDPAPSDPDPSDPDIYDLAPDSFNAILGDGPKPCPSCGQPIPSGSVLCLGCGYDERKGRQLSTGIGVDDPDDPTAGPAPKGKPAARQCPKCGYDLKGLKTPRCPECGTLVLPKSKREILEEEGRRTARMEYIRPLTMLGVGLAGIALVFLAGNDAKGLGFYLLTYLVSVPAGVAAFFFLCLIWFGFNAPMHLTALRLAGIFAITDLVTVVTGLTKLPIIIWPATFFTYYGLIMKELDIDDWKEAFAFSFVMNGLKYAIFIGLAAALMGA